jgi:precorrin-2 dehydrogenase/sirohydrochlorin ferrochelatase
MNPHNPLENEHFPYSVSLYLVDAPCLVVGGGTVALRKTKSLLFAGARITVVSPGFIPEFESLQGIKTITREFRTEDLEDKFLVISATDNRALNESVAREAKRRNMLVNVVDVPDLCNFFVNSQVRRGDLSISISTGGASPALSKRIRKELEQQYGEGYRGFLRLMREYRPVIISRVTDPGQRKKVFERLAAARIETLLEDKGEAAAREAIERVIDENAVTPDKEER